MVTNWAKLMVTNWAMLISHYKNMRFEACLFLSLPLCFSLAFFGLPLFQFLFLCLSLALFFLSSFLSFLFAFFWFLGFLSFFLSLSSLLLFHGRNNIKIFNCKVFFHQSFVFFVFCLAFSLKSSFVVFVFSWLSVIFLSTSMSLVSKNTSWKTPIFGQEGGCNKRSFFFIINLCFQNCEKLAFLGTLFLAKFGWCSKKHYK